MTTKATKKTAKKTTGATTAATKAKGTPKATPKAKTPKVATRAKPAAKGGSKPKPKAPKRKGILDIAAEMLAKSKKPMTCKQIVEQAIAKGLWQTKGRTPSATLYAAIIREIAAKGKDARFKKVDRGLFTCGVGK